MSITRSHVCTDCSSVGTIWSATPALFTNRSTRPNSRMMASVRRSISASLVTSPPTANAWHPTPLTSCAVASAASRLRSNTTTCAPSRAHANAVALPMPLPAPVITPTLSCKRICLPSLRSSIFYPLSLAFHRSCRQPLNHVFLQINVEYHDRQGCQERRPHQFSPVIDIGGEKLVQSHRQCAQPVARDKNQGVQE